jgi:hypothetical protein
LTNTPARQLFLTELGHEEPTILLTNHLLSPAGKRVERYARRMLIENGLADAVDFFHLEALSSALRLKVDFDVTLTGVATGLYRMIARKLPGDEAAKGRQIFPISGILRRKSRSARNVWRSPYQSELTIRC